MPILVIDPQVEKEQVRRLKDLKDRRDKQRHAQALEHLREAAAANQNVMPQLVEAAEADATVAR